jgi:hypothetical protein
MIARNMKTIIGKHLVIKAIKEKKTFNSTNLLSQSSKLRSLIFL